MTSLQNEKMKNESKELVMKLLVGLRFFVPICHFSVPRARFPLPVPLFSNVHLYYHDQRLYEDLILSEGVSQVT